MKRELDKIPQVFRYNRPIGRIDGYKLAQDFFTENPRATHVIIQGKLFTK